MLVLGAAVAFARLSLAGGGGTFWAEDGAVFYADAVTKGAWSTFFQPYAGYMHAVPRISSDLVAALPISWAAASTGLIAALLQAVIAVVAYAALRGVLPSRWPRLLLAAYVFALPVAPELMLSTANLQWFWLFGGCLVILWKQQSRAALIASGLVTGAVTLTSPFGVVIFGLAVVRLVLLRDKTSGLLAIIASVGLSLQTFVMLHAPARTGAAAVHHQILVSRLVYGFVVRVAGDGVLGIARYPAGKTVGSLSTGVAVLSLVAVLFALLARRAGISAVAMPATLLGLSVATYLVLAVLSGMHEASPTTGGRYNVPPALFLVAAAVILAGRLVASDDAPDRRQRVWRSLEAVGGGVLVASLVVGIVWGYVATRNPRAGAPTWTTSVAQGRVDCRHGPTSASARLPIAPRGWSVRLTCAELA